MSVMRLCTSAGAQVARPLYWRFCTPANPQKSCRTSSFPPTFWSMTMTFLARLQADRNRQRKEHSAEHSYSHRPTWCVLPSVPDSDPEPLRRKGRGQAGGVGGLAVATPVLGGVCRHKTYPRSYRRVGGRYRQSVRQNNFN